MTIRPVALAAVGLLALAACGKTNHGAAAPTTTTAATTSSTAPPETGAPAITTTLPAVATTVPASTTTLPATTSTTAPAPAQNLTVTASIRAQLLAAGAQSHGLQASDYTGLRPGETYYAYDPSTTTYWAAAGLMPSASSLPAQVSSQDDGAYLLYQRPAGGAWKVFDIGLAGVGGTPCSVVAPPAIVALWGWPAPGCRPAQI